jgi:acetyl esterase/lipase
MKLQPAVLGLLFCHMTAHAQTTNSFPLWSDGAPGALGTKDKDIPTLTPYLLKETNAPLAAFVICPGGGYGHLADHEGSHYARWLNGLGIAGFVLKYRVGAGGYRHPAMLQDAARAVRIVRARAAEWNIDPNRVGIMGSSAGGHLAATLLTHFRPGNPAAIDPIERESSRPDLGILCYPVITMTAPFAHEGSKSNLLGENPSAELVRELSNELHVKTNTPPCFIWHTYQDKTVPVENSLEFAAALRRAGVHFDLHIYERGLHGIGLGTRAGYDPAKFLPWTRDCEYWLKQKGFVKETNGVMRIPHSPALQ